MRNKAGFTLIEIMVSLVLVGLIASVAGTSVLMGLRGYLNTRENNVITQKAQLAMNRLNREFIELSAVKDDTESCIIYESPYGWRAIKMVEVEGKKTIRLFFIDATVNSCDSLAAGDTLVDGVYSFAIRYNPDTTGTTSLWSKSQDIRNLYALSVQMALNQPETGGRVPFSTTVSPRNNNNAGGSAVPTPDTLSSDYAGKCFVATAAWGDRDHPMVELLREFRERVLVKTEPGMALIQYYYRVGPTLAAAIEGNPLACLLARTLIAPVAGLAFFVLYYPLLIPLVLILSWGLARLILSRRRWRLFHWSPSPKGQRGAILVTLIAAMVVFSALSAVMISMFGASSLGQAASNHVMRAYYLAESGFRYAASVYVNAADEAARENLMLAMHNQEYTLAGNEGKFRLSVYPYYAKSTQPPNGNELTTMLPGGIPIPGGDFNWGSWVKVQKPNGVITFNRISGVSTLAPNTVRFYQINALGNILNWDASYGTGSLITLVCIPDRTVNSRRLIYNDGRYDLAYAVGTGALAFPERNGAFSVRFEGESTPRILSYKQRNLNTSRLEGISDTGGRILPTGAMVDPGSSAPYQNFIELAKFVRLESTGILGAGSTALSRKVTYEIPIGYMTAAAPKTEVKEQFGSGLQNWFTGSEVSHIGTQAVEGSAMRLTGERTTNVAPASLCLLFRENQIALDWRKAFSSSGASENFETEWRRAGRYLSYDVQTKIFLDSTNQVYAGGLSFRLDEAGNSLGFTILSSVTGVFPNGCDKDGIPDSLTGGSSLLQYQPYLILWMKEVARTERNFSTDPSQHEDPSYVSGPPPTGTGTRAIPIGGCSFWRTGDRVQFNNSGGSLPGGITAGVDYFIRVITYYDVNSIAFLYGYLFDTYEHALGLDAALPWQGLRDITSAGSGISNMVAQDPQWSKLVQKGLTQWPYTGGDLYRILKPNAIHFRDWTTLKVRVIEAPSLSFVNGGGAGLEIVSGNIVYQTQDNSPGGTVTAIAQVRNNPIYWNRYEWQPADWGWEAGTAAGVLILDVLKDGQGNLRPIPFANSKRIFVGEPPGGTWMATVGIPSSVTDESIPMRTRDNWVQVFVGDPEGPNNPNDNPLDIARALSPRDQIYWAPDRIGYPGITTPENDRFSLVRMGDYRNICFARRFVSKQNTEADTRGDFIRLGKGQYDGSTFFSTPTSGTAFSSSRPEIGLHAYGPSATMTNLYFDDFAVRFGPVGGVKSGFLLPVQH